MGFTAVGLPCGWLVFGSRYPAGLLGLVGVPEKGLNQEYCTLSKILVGRPHQIAVNTGAGEDTPSRKVWTMFNIDAIQENSSVSIRAEICRMIDLIMVEPELRHKRYIQRLITALVDKS